MGRKGQLSFETYIDAADASVIATSVEGITVVVVVIVTCTVDFSRELVVSGQR